MNATQKDGPLCLRHAASDNNLLIVSQLKAHDTVANGDSRDRINRAMDLVIELEIDATTLRMLVMGLATEQDVVVLGVARCIGSPGHSILKARLCGYKLHG